MFLNNKFTKWYYKIIENAKKEKRQKYKGIYYERHHIIPKSFGGSNEKQNLVLLTAREHYICHLLLCQMTEGKNRMKMALAYHRLAHLTKNVIDSRSYQNFKNYYQKYHSGKNHHMYGTKRPQEAIEKTRRANLGRKILNTEKHKIANAGKNNPQYGKIWINNGIKGRLMLRNKTNGQFYSKMAI